MKNTNSYIVWRTSVLSLLRLIPSLYGPRESLDYHVLRSSAWQSHIRELEWGCRKDARRPPVSVSCGCHENYHKLVGLQLYTYFFSHSSGGQKSEVSVLPGGHAPSRGSRRVPIPVSSSVYGCQHPWTCGCITPISASVFSWPSLLCVSAPLCV